MEAEKYISTSSAAVTKSEFTINDLIDECLGIIFNNLSYRDRVDIESVCKRWRDIGDTNWCMYSKHLTIDEDTDTFPFVYDNTPEENQTILEKILERRGQYLEEITFTTVDFRNFKVGTINRIVECCPRLKHLRTGMLRLDSEDWFACSNLEGLSCRNDGDHLRELFRRNKRLRWLQIEYSICKASTFDYLDPGQLEILHLLFSNLVFTAGLADKLAESLVELNYKTRDIVGDLRHLSKLKNLRTLILNFLPYGLVDTRFIVDIAENCKKLEYITLYIYNVPNLNFIPLLFNMPCLKSLVIILRQYEIPHEELHRLFRKAPNLKFFVLSSCSDCTYEDNNVKRCYKHRNNRIKCIKSVARNTNEAVIITKYSKIPNMEAQKYISKSSTAVTKSEFTINDLSDDSLNIIFNNLSYRDRVGIESVCKRWRDTSKTNWCLYSKHLTIDEDTDNFPSVHDNTPEENQNILEKILERRGQYLEEITFTTVDIRNFKVGTINRVVECCPRLKHLKTGMLKLNSEDWFACRNLERLSCRDDDNQLRELFHRNKRLRQLKIEYSTYNASTFDHLDPGQLEILHLLFSNLVFTAGLADKLAESLVELNYEPHDIVVDLRHLSKLKNLRTLILNLIRSLFVDIHLIFDIAENCKKLEHITLYIFNVPNLNFIPLLFNMPCLKSLVIILRQYEIPREELHRLFRKAPNLKFFVLSSCSDCTYQDDNVKRCYKHRNNRVKTTKSVARDTNEAVIITAA